MIQKQDSYFKAHDHHRLYFCSTIPKKPKAVLVFVHGLNEHTGRYEHVADQFKDDYAVYLFDQRGHGRSDGIRAHVEDFDHYVKDLREFLRLVHKKHEGTKIFLIGHSMGGQVVVNYLARYKKTLVDGFVTSSANLKVAIAINPLKKFLGIKLADVVPKFKLPSEIDAKLICRNPDVVSAYQKDPLVSKKISLKLASSILINQDEVLEKAPEIKIPALLMHGGDDQICAPQGTQDFFDRLASEDKVLHFFEGMYHEIFNEIGNDEVFAVMGSWIKEHL